MRAGGGEPARGAADDARSRTRLVAAAAPAADRDPPDRRRGLLLRRGGAADGHDCSGGALPLVARPRPPAQNGRGTPPPATPRPPELDPQICRTIFRSRGGIKYN